MLRVHRRRPAPRGRGASLLFASVLAAAFVGPAAAEAVRGPDEGPDRAETRAVPELHTNQGYIDELKRPTRLDIDKPAAVFEYVFAKLPDRVKVYPTENYWYFTFVYGGAPYNGNLRLDASDRDQGKIHFAYSEDLAEWRDETDVIHVVLDQTNDVVVEKVEPLVYRVAFRGKTVEFALNDLSKVKPPADALGPDETLVGPICDESGIRFFLVFNRRLKIFHYILDETEPVLDQLEPRPNSRIVVGKRTGFAFYRDDRRPRKILVGVNFNNSRVNNYFDGPFDQLPDNFIEGDSFRDMILSVAPELKGKIDRFGGWADGAQRFMIAPYYYYRRDAELAGFDRCATDKRVPAARWYTCFVADEARQQKFELLPQAIAELSGKGAGGRQSRR